MSSPAPIGSRAGTPGFCWAGRLLVALVFLVTGLSKLELPMEFAKEIQNYKMAPIEITAAMAHLLPMLEIVSALILIFGPWRRESRLLILIMLVVFTAAKTAALVQDPKFQCGCVGGSFALLKPIFEGWNGVALNLLCIGLLIVDWVYSGDAERRRARISVESATA